METVKLRVSLYEAPDEQRELTLASPTLNLAPVCEHAAALFAETRRSALAALTFTLDGERIDLGATPADKKLAADGGKLVIGYRPLGVSTVMPSA